MLSEFPPWEEPATSKTGRDLARFRNAMRQLQLGPAGRAFNRLQSSPDYKAQFDAGYRTGLEAGLALAKENWYKEYGEVIRALVNSMQSLAVDPALGAMLVAATLDELFVRPRSGTPTHLNPRYRKLMAALRPGGQVVAGPQEELAETLESAAWADAMQQVAIRLEGESMIDRIDFTVADFAAAIEDELTGLANATLELNCQPFQQGQLVGLWLGEATVNTLRQAIEATLSYAGKNPDLFLFGPLTKYDVAQSLFEKLSGEPAPTRQGN